MDCRLPVEQPLWQLFTQRMLLWPPVGKSAPSAAAGGVAGVSIGVPKRHVLVLVSVIARTVFSCVAVHVPVPVTISTSDTAAAPPSKR